MRSLMFLCAFCLFAIAQGKLYYQDDIQNYYKCWTYMNCISDGQMARKMEKCFDFLKPKDFELYFEYVEENYHIFRNHTLPGFLNEYCNADAEEQQDLYQKVMDALQGFEKVISSDPDLVDMHSRGGEFFNCVMLYLEKKFPDDECKIEMNMKK